MRHKGGGALVDEVLSLGFDALELGYHTTEEIADGIRRKVRAGEVTVGSVHAFCPVPVGAPHGYPELYLLASLDDDERAMAAILLGQTLAFAETMGAKAVVLHAGRVFLKSWLGDLSTDVLVETLEDADGRPEAPEVQRVLGKALRRRARRARKVFDCFCRSLETLLPRFERAGVTLCLENLPSLEAFPDEGEMQALKRRFGTSALAYWHDMGHGQVRENLGIIHHAEAARDLLPFTRGIHIHDAHPPAYDHLPPGKGRIDFGAFSFYRDADIIKVFEPSPHVNKADLETSLRHVRKVWQEDGERSG
jgi:sugar phosphate isomerase/epimerase